MASIAAVNSLGGFAHNPRGNLWLNDESTVGHKLLTKMGWSKGKGLGSKEDGIKENIKVKNRNSGSGVGYKDESFFKVQSTEYDDLLRSISLPCAQRQGDTSGKLMNHESGSLEQRSQSFRNRLHYQKFVRGKDLSKYSEKDMKSIFILNTAPEKEQIVPKDTISMEEKRSGNKGSDVMETYNSQLNMSDYFALKMKDKKSLIKISHGSSSLMQDSENVEKENSALNNSKDHSFKKSKQKDISSDEANANNVEESGLKLSEPIMCSIKRKRSGDLTLNNFSYESKNFKIAEFNSDCPLPKKRRKKPKISDDSNLTISKLLEENIDCQENVTIVTDVDSDSIEILESKSRDNTLSPSKKSKNLFFKDLTCNNSSNEGKNFKLVKTSDCSLPKKKRKKNKISEDKCNLTASKLFEEDIDCQEIVTIVTDVDSDSIEILENKLSSIKKCKKSKRKKIKLKALKSILKCKRGKYSVKNVSFDESVSYRIIDPREDPDGISNEEISDIVEPECVTLDDGSDIKDAEAPEIEVIEEKVCTKAHAEMEVIEESEDGCSLSNLPNSKSSYYNCWIESQRQALKMKLYKNMLKNIKKHAIFRTSNLLSIRGYGNWGY